MKRYLAVLLLWLGILFTPSIVCAKATDGFIQRGVSKTLFSVLELPYWMIRGSATSFPVGILTGTIQGASRAVLGTVTGAVDLAVGLAPYAKYAALAL